MKTFTLEAINDTRSWDWQTGKAIPGSGCAAQCEHCNKLHEIHCTIYNKHENKRLVVGSGCAKKLCWNAKKLSTANLKADAKWKKHLAAIEGMAVQKSVYSAK